MVQHVTVFMDGAGNIVMSSISMMIGIFKAAKAEQGQCCVVVMALALCQRYQMIRHRERQDGVPVMRAGMVFNAILRSATKIHQVVLHLVVKHVAGEGNAMIEKNALVS